MSDPSSVLSGWQLALIIVVPTILLVGWLIAVFLAAREPRAHALATASAPVVKDAGETPGAAGAAGHATTGQDETARPGQGEAARPDRRLAA
jgi:hypothetical protein